MVGRLLLVVGTLLAGAICLWRVPWQAVSSTDSERQGRIEVWRPLGDGSLTSPPRGPAWRMTDGAPLAPAGESATVDGRALAARLLIAAVLTGLGGYLIFLARRIERERRDARETDDSAANE